MSQRNVDDDLELERLDRKIKRIKSGLAAERTAHGVTRGELDVAKEAWKKQEHRHTGMLDSLGRYLATAEKERDEAKDTCTGIFERLRSDLCAAQTALDLLETDIAEHLPTYANEGDEPCNARETVEHAGAELERLRGENKTLRGWLSEELGVDLDAALERIGETIEECAARSRESRLNGFDDHLDNYAVDSEAEVDDD